MGFHSLIIVLITFAITVDVTSSQEALDSFHGCIVEHGLPSNLIVHHSTSNSDLYAELDHRWNVRPLHVHPLAYFVPRMASDVQVSIISVENN